MNKKEEIIQMLKNNPIKIIKCGDIEIPVEYLKQTTVAVNGDDYIRLQRENKILRENAENNDKVVDKVNWKNQLLKKENQELKKQLEDMTLCRDIASGHREEVQNRETILLNQQKEFIKYLEDNWKQTQDIWYIKILQKYKEIIGDDK